MTKEKSEFQKNYNINLKIPVVIKNALPCNLRIRSDFIKNAKKNENRNEKNRDEWEF